MNIQKVTKDLNKKYKGKITIQEVIAELEAQGYDTVFFNTQDGDEILSAYTLDPCDDCAFTYCGVTKIVFVDGNLHTADKLCVLLHELGHIMLGHIGNGNAEYTDAKTAEIEADVFAYNILHPQKPKKAHVLITAAILMITIFLGMAVGYTTSPTLNAAASEYVYIASTGTKYHRINCIHTKDKPCAAVLLSEARKCFSPCLVCNP